MHSQHSQLRLWTALSESFLLGGDLKNLTDRLNFDLLQIRDGDVGMVPSVLCSYILDPNGWVDGFLTVCTQYEARLESSLNLVHFQSMH